MNVLDLSPSAEPSSSVPIAPAVPVGAAPPTAPAGPGAGLPGPAPRRGRLIGLGLVGAGIVLLPWLVVLATSLPATATASHWSAAWVGLDAMEAAGLITTGVLVARGDRHRGPAAAATGMLLVVDAWFDVMTAAPGADRLSALAMAGFAELPLAVLCAVLAVRSVRPASAR